jgi:lysine decarboxylase
MSSQRQSYRNGPAADKRIEDHGRMKRVNHPSPWPADPRGLRGDAPLLDAYLAFLEAGTRPFTIPGHKQRTDLVGTVVAGDVPLYGGLDTMKLSGGVLARAERRAALLWGADVCRFSVGGSTHGNQALALAVAEPGARVVVSRSLHRSLLLGLVLAGLEPVWVRPTVDLSTGLPAAVSVSDVEAALQAHPEVRAVFLGDPSYVGTFGDLAGHARAAHAHGIPLIVDAAWAAHFGFHPDLPSHPLALGADAMVTSAHKTLPAYSQGAMVLANTERVDADRLERAFEATHTTSPAGAILASIDAARALLERDGEELVGRLLRRVADARRRLRAIEGVEVLDGPGVDPGKLVVLLAGTGASGYAVETELIARQMPLEMADQDTVIPMLTMADDDAGVDELTEALTNAIARHRGSPRRPVSSAAWSVAPETVMAPREAFFARHVSVPAEAAVGRVSAEIVAPYPPGVPVLAPGERVTRAALDSLVRARDEGARIAYAADVTLATLQVVLE